MKTIDEIKAEYAAILLQEAECNNKQLKKYDSIERSAKSNGIVMPASFYKVKQRLKDRSLNGNT